MSRSIDCSSRKEIRVTKGYFLRDVCFLTIVNFYLLFCLIAYKEIDVIISIGFLLIYAVFVTIVVAQSKMSCNNEDILMADET